MDTPCIYTALKNCYFAERKQRAHATPQVLGGHAALSSVEKQENGAGFSVGGVKDRSRAEPRSTPEIASLERTPLSA